MNPLIQKLAAAPRLNYWLGPGCSGQPFVCCRSKIFWRGIKRASIQIRRRKHWRIWWPGWKKISARGVFSTVTWAA